VTARRRAHLAPGHARRPHASSGARVVASRRRAQPSARQLELGGALAAAVGAPRARPVPPAFFWRSVAQHVARAAAKIPLRDVEAAVAGAGAFALWALALSLLVP
jgi:hypothetical protein